MFNLLKICDYNDFYFFIKSFSFDIICYIGIVICLALCILIQFSGFFGKDKNYVIVRNIGLVLSSVFIVFISLSFFFLYYSDHKNCIEKAEKFYTDSKFIFTGDSRMEFIEVDDDIVKPYNVSFVAKSGAKIDYFEEKLIPELEDDLNDRNKKFNYYVTFNMGVNDINDKINVRDRADEYFELYSSIAKKYKNVKFYIVSVNPVIEKKLNKSQKNNIRTNNKIVEFNDEIKYKLNDYSYKNLFYCDTYSGMKFGSPDGLHYDEKTDVKFMNYVIDKCMMNK